jgi:hypothetical protein
MALLLRDVHAGYTGVPVVRGVSAAVPEGGSTPVTGW